MTGVPEPVRSRVVALAAAALGSTPAAEVPAGLRKVAAFTPAKRAKLGAVELVAALRGEPLFRQRVLERARAEEPEDSPALAWLAQSPSWESVVEAAAAAHQSSRAAASGTAETDAVRRLAQQLEELRAAHRQALTEAEAEGRATKDELAVVRRKIRDLGSRLGRAEQAKEAAEAELAEAAQASERSQQSQAVELQRLRDALADAEREAAAARQVVRDGSKGDQLRQRLLLDSLVNAAQGLRRELALPALEGRPADALVTDYAVARPAVQGRGSEDPAYLEALLAVPMTHLVVDGYNVTKTAWGAQTLEQQRARLVAGVGAVAARTGAEVTVVFDGAEVTVTAPAQRLVRVMFSRSGEIADEVIRRLVRHEPRGRPIVVVSSDKEVADGVRESGAVAVPSLALVRLLERSVGGLS